MRKETESWPKNGTMAWKDLKDRDDAPNYRFFQGIAAAFLLTAMALLIASRIFGWL